jgi:hypothetical protein
MKKIALALAISAMASTASAGGGKISILHCGIEYGDETMNYVEISVSKKAKGHFNHVAGSIDSVDTGMLDGDELPIFVDYVRNGSDCVLGEDLWGDLQSCGELQTEGTECGSMVLDQI